MAIIGIDLGTTNSLVGVIEKGRPRLFTDEAGKRLIPSVVHYSATGEVLVGQAAKSAPLTSPLSTIYSAKRLIGRGKADLEAVRKMSAPYDFSPSTEQLIHINIGHRKVNPIEVSAEILKKLKGMAERELGEAVEKAVITVPAYFNDSQRQATKVAGKLAGLEVLRIVNEPTAACLAYGLDKKAQGLVAVFDLGGGTFDFSLLKVSGGIFEVLATSGDTALGGDDFNHALAQVLETKLTAQGQSLPSTDEGRFQLLRQAETLKHELSESDEAKAQLRTGTGETTVTVTRTEFEAAIRPFLERARGPVLQALADSKLSATQISDVILVGGSTRVPLVRELVREIFGREPICTLNPDEVVAMGATIQANILAGQMTGMLLLDVVPLSLGIETMGGVVSKIIHRNSTVPTSATEHFSTYVDGQVSVLIHVLQGERELAADNRSLGRFELKIDPLPAGIPKIEVEFIIDANGILNVKAIELRTMKSASIQVNPSYGLSDEEVEKMLMASFDHAEADFEKRFLIEAKIEAESLIRTTQKALATAGNLLSPDERSAIEGAITDLQNSLNESNRQKIKAANEQLAKITEPFAQALLNQAVKTALKDKEL